ncbi:MAG: hypothetical protein NXI04_08735 [Planctomycetaceae bacterium]|nr:hypothetical protein [Planctomycetaceae bacterium]
MCVHRHLQPLRLAAVAVLHLTLGSALAQQDQPRVDETPPGELQQTQAEGSADPVIAFARMDSDRVRTEVLSWLASSGQTAETLKNVAARWADTQALSRLTGEQLLDLAVESFAVADEGTRQLLEATYTDQPVDAILFDGIRNSPFYESQVRLLHGRWLTQHRYYDEALAMMEPLNPEDVIDPASLLFYRAVGQAELLRRRDALDSLALLLYSTQEVPRRFQIVAEMLQEDLMGREDEGMDLVERLMKDVERRLELGESGKPTQDQGDAIIAALDKLLEDMESEQEQQQQNGSGNGGGQQQAPQQAANQSTIKGGSADGEADRKNLTEEGSWGMLDSKAEARARELIRGKLPANYLDQIGRFSRKLAEQK